MLLAPLQLLADVLDLYILQNLVLIPVPTLGGMGGCVVALTIPAAQLGPVDL